MSFAHDAPGVEIVSDRASLGDECAHVDISTGEECHEDGEYLANLMFDKGVPAEVLICREHLAIQREFHPESVISCRIYRRNHG